MTSNSKTGMLVGHTALYQWHLTVSLLKLTPQLLLQAPLLWERNRKRIQSIFIRRQTTISKMISEEEERGLRCFLTRSQSFLQCLLMTTIKSYHSGKKRLGNAKWMSIRRWLSKGGHYQCHNNTQVASRTLREYREYLILRYQSLQIW